MDVPERDDSRVFFVRWFWRPFFEQVVYALGVLVVTSVSDVSQLLRGTFASSTKYLMQSRRPYLAALYHTVTLYLLRYLSFFNEIFQDVHVTTHAACSAASSSVSREGFTLSKRNRRQSRCPPRAACLHDASSSHGQSLEKQYFNISRFPLRAAT